ncbi:LacI family transcriptional regulator [Trinickia symbiotica]|uniref:LacI family transcriptional regulator n=1 Tax=Trinickia symbiotica TaxID=863227 RepID=A0A2N7X4R5_9BURK|nr:LacI family DNA-binding transcriptional regulator [Trinickia symbiotica]PMS36571.1 LacI family transcriptional regulator [Trinickia symbiotica]PPK45981.1 LacI family transcriptional regulator [Trinickia symbiotica]
MATMKDVARLAEVSVATVSAVLSGSTYVSPDLTARVRSAVKTLGYAPNTIASSLKKGTTKLLGLVVPDITNPFFTELVHCIQKRAHALGYSVLLFDSDRDFEQERAYLRMLRAHLAVGTILCASAPERSYDELRSDSGFMPIVVVDHVVLSNEWDSVALDNMGAARLAVEHILKFGHKRIAIIAGPTYLVPGRDRLRGFEHALAAANVPVVPEYVRQGAFGEPEAYQAALELMDLPEPPSAIFVANNQMLIGTMRALAEKRVACPEDVSVTAIDDFPWASAFSPALTTVRQPVDSMAQAALRMLIERINGDDRSPRHMVFSPELVVRQSCKSPPSRGDSVVSSASPVVSVTAGQ